MEISSPTSSPCYCQTQGASRSFSASETRMASIKESQSLDMYLETAEGDKVTLSYDAYAAAFYAEHTQVDAKADGLSVQWAEFSAGQYDSKVSLQVEGDLNKQEQRDIRKAIKTIGKMLKKFVQGRVRPMMAKAEKLAGLETIATLDVSMAYERQMMTARQTDMVLAYDQQGDKLNQPAQAPVSVRPELQAETEAVVNEMVKIARAVRAPRENMLQMTERMLSRQRKEMAKMDALVVDLFDHIEDRFKALFMEDEAFKKA